MQKLEKFPADGTVGCTQLGRVGSQATCGNEWKHSIDVKSKSSWLKKGLGKTN